MKMAEKFVAVMLVAVLVIGAFAIATPAFAKKPKAPIQCPIIPLPNGCFIFDEDFMATPECEYILVCP